jgi:Flp pilus assembly protein TadG
MLRVAWSALGRLKADERGAALLLFTIMLVPMLAVVAVAIDLSRVLLIKQKLVNAADAAALAVGARSGLSSDEATAMAQSFIRAHYPDAEFGDLQGFNVVPGTTQVDVIVTARIPMTFLQVINVTTMDITVHSQAARAQRKLEIALVLDRTGSMAGKKITDLKAAAKDLIDIVVWDNQTDTYYSKVALVPYAAGVNVGDQYRDQVRGGITLGTCLQNIPGCLLFLFTNATGGLRTYQISSCVSERAGAHAFTDAAPSAAFLGRNYPAANNPCPSDAVVPLTNDKSLLKGRIDALQASGSTAGHIGTAWGWYLLSPNFGYLWPVARRPAPYSELAERDPWGQPILEKIVVLMTDGEFNTMYCNGVISRDSWSGSGSASDHINCDAPNGSSIAQAQSVCGNMKAAGVTVYTVGFALAEQSAINLMGQCATDATHAYLASNGAELRAAFRDIATRIVSLRLTQ